jgi:hypothetical protein
MGRMEGMMLISLLLGSLVHFIKELDEHLLLQSL